MDNSSISLNMKNINSSELRESLKILSESFSKCSSQVSFDFAGIKNSLASLSITLNETIGASSEQAIADFTLAVRELVSYLSDGSLTSSNISEVMNYIEQHQDLIDDVSVNEAVDQIDNLYANDCHIDLSPTQLSLLGITLSALSSLQDQDSLLFCAWLVIALLTIFANNSE